MRKFGTRAGVLVLLASGCAEVATSSFKPGQRSQRSQAPPTPPSASAPVVAQSAGEHATGLPNLHRLSEEIYSGGVPGGEVGFDELKALGVKTVISVDGATPDIVSAEARGMRYVHLPITYAEVSDVQTLALARAIRDLPGPVYVHCHHGKHRAPAAVAAAGVALGVISPDEGVVFMKKAGTAPNYQGLYNCVATGTTLDAAAIDAAPADFPKMHRSTGLVTAMIEIDAAFENLGEIRAAQWNTPPEHPDLVPAAEAGRLADHLRFATEDPSARALGDDFMAKMRTAIDLASALEEAIVRNASRDELEAAHQVVNASCKACHAVYRDKPR